MKNVSFYFRKNAIAAFSLLVAGFLFTACNKSNFSNNDNTPVAGLMAFNLAPDKAAVGVSLSGSSISAVPLTYTSYTGTYLSIFPGSRTVESFDNNGWSVASPDFTFEPKKYYSVFVVGANNSYRNVIVQDNFDSLSFSSGKAYVRYINAIPDSARPTVTISANGTSVINEAASFAAVSEFKAVMPGEVAIHISNGGTISADRTITLEGTKVYTVLLTGIAGSATTPVQIKYITNGQLDGTEGQRRVSSAVGAGAIK